MCNDAMRAELMAATIAAINEVGLAVFKRTPLFMSNRVALEEGK